MKKNLLLFALPVLVLVMASCSNDDEVKPQNIITGEAIKTSLAISVPSEEYSTRQSADITQNNTIFRGISDMMLYPMSAVPNIALEDNALPSSGLGQSLGSPTSVSTTNSHHIYQNVQLPIGATHFLLYGKAPKDTYSDFVAGKLTSSTPSNATNTSAINFALNNIVTTTDLETPQQTFIDYLNNIANAKDGTNLWKDATDSNLKDAYNTFTMSSPNGQRAGSAFMIKAHVQDLYDKMTLVGAISSDATVQAIATAVKTAINASIFDADGSGVLTFKSGLATTITNFPQEQNLPDGAALLSFVSGEFVYLNSYTTSSTTGAMALDILNLTYPAELMYYSNSPLKAYNATVSDWNALVGTTSASWNGCTWTGWTNKIDLTTRTVALQNNMHYGVACLETTVKCGKSILEDNASVVSGALQNQSITVPTGGFPVTAILVGGQPEKVDWNCIDNGATTGSFKKTVYDKDMPSGMSAKYNTASPANYTLLLDNVVPGALTQDVVNLCVELENNSGQGFYGVNGYIPTGAKFYLIGKLDPAASGLGTITFPTDADRRIYPKTGTKRVFMQDYMTSANITINSLKNAYVTIPDMRSVKLELGVSVDLEWLAGFDFDVTIE